MTEATRIHLTEEHCVCILYSFLQIKKQNMNSTWVKLYKFIYLAGW